MIRIPTKMTMPLSEFGRRSELWFPPSLSLFGDGMHQYASLYSRRGEVELSECNVGVGGRWLSSERVRSS